MKKTVSAIKEYVKNFHRRIRKKNLSPETLREIEQQISQITRLYHETMHVARFGKCQDQHCRECPVQKCNPENATKRMFRHIYVIFSGKSSCSTWIFLNGCPISVTSQNYVQNIKFEIRWKKKGMGKESLIVSMETNPCIVDPINCHQWPL